MKNVSLTVLLVIALLVVVVGLLPLGGAQAAPESLRTRTVLQVLNASGITQTVNSAAKTVGQYVTADCYSIVNVTASQTATIKLQHSPDNLNWVDLYSYPDVSADSTSFTHTLVYGEYLRASVSALGTANPLSVVVRCVVKD